MNLQLTVFDEMLKIKTMAKEILKVQKKNIPLINFSKFKGKEVAIVKGEIVAAGKTSKEAFKKAKKLFPEKPAKDIILLSIPKEEVFIYFIKNL